MQSRGGVMLLLYSLHRHRSVAVSHGGEVFQGDLYLKNVGYFVYLVMWKILVVFLAFRPAG